jgi:hypothetical protein
MDTLEDQQGKHGYSSEKPEKTLLHIGLLSDEALRTKTPLRAVNILCF